MAFNTPKSFGDLVDQTDWNDFVNYTTAFSSNALSKYLNSSSFARLNWDSNLWHNSGLVWDSSISKWKAKKSGATGGVSDLDDLNINVEKDWLTYGIYNLGEIRAGTGNDLGDYKLQIFGDTFLSGNVTFVGEISGVSDPTYASGVSNKHYVDVISSNISHRFAPSKSTSTGLSTINNAYGEITHNLISIPNYWNVKPSGTSANFGISTKVDANKIYVYLTTLTSRNVYWYAST